MPDNNFLDAFSQTEIRPEFQQPEAISRLKTPDDFRGGLFNRPDVNSVQAAQAFRSAIEAGDLGVTQQFIDAGIIDNLHQVDAQKAFEMIEKVKDVQGRFTPKGIERFGGMRRILREGLPGEQKPQTIQTPKGPQQKLTKAPSQDDMFFQEFNAAATPEEQNEILDRFSRFQKAKKGESPFEVEKAPEQIKEPSLESQFLRRAGTQIRELERQGKPIPERLKAIREGRQQITPDKPEATKLQAINGIALARAAIVRLKTKNLSQTEIDNEPDPVIRAFLLSRSKGQADPDSVKAAIEAQEARIRFFQKFAPGAEKTPEIKDRTQALKSIFSP